MHRSRLDMRGADAGAGGMSISSGSDVFDTLTLSFLLDENILGK